MLQTLTDYARKRYAGKTYYSKNAMEKFNTIKLLVGIGQNVLELGCGDGTLQKMLNEHNTVVGLDIDNCDLQKDELPYKDGVFDTVVACEIIEHIWDSDRFLQEIRRVLEPRGRLIITTPNLASLGRRFMLLCGRNPHVDNFLYPNDAGHIKHFTQKDFRYLLEKNNFEIDKFWSDVVNLSPDGKRYSVWLATIFPRLGRSIIAVCVK